jgi:hypothetical protein
MPALLELQQQKQTDRPKKRAFFQRRIVLSYIDGSYNQASQGQDIRQKEPGRSSGENGKTPHLWAAVHHRMNLSSPDL